MIIISEEQIRDNFEKISPFPPQKKSPHSSTNPPPLSHLRQFAETKIKNYQSDI